jgi:outer membrane lipase/esterase
MGLDYHWGNWLAGAAVTLGYENPSFSLGGGFKQNQAMLSLYAGYRDGPWWADVIASYGALSDSTDRLVPIGITVQPNLGSTSGSDVSIAGEVGYDFRTGFLTHGPLVGLIVQRVTIDGFTETGSFTSLSFASQTRNSEVTALGYRASFDWGIWHPFAQVVWDHEFDPLNRSVTVSLTTMAAPSFAMPAVQVGRDWATATLGTQVRIDRSWTGLASFSAQIGERNVTSYGGLLGLSYTFGWTAAPALVTKG